MKKTWRSVLFGMAMIAMQSTWAQDKADVTDMQRCATRSPRRQESPAASTLNTHRRRSQEVLASVRRLSTRCRPGQPAKNVVLQVLIGRRQWPLADLYARNLAT